MSNFLGGIRLDFLPLSLQYKPYVSNSRDGLKLKQSEIRFKLSIQQSADVKHFLTYHK